MAQGKLEQDAQTTPTFSWLDLGLEILKALATPDEGNNAPVSSPEPPDGRVFAHYVAYSGRNLLALVIGQDEEKGYRRADLAVFTNLKNAAGKKNFGLQFHQDVTYSEMKLPGTWHWLE